MNAEAAVTALIVNHNGAQTVARAIESVRKQVGLVREVIVVDNASTDGSPERIRGAFPDVRVIALDENRGPARARNVGLAHAQTELLLWMDDDIYLAPDSLLRMITALQETGAAMACPRIVFPKNQRIQIDGAGIHFCSVMTLGNAGAPADHAAERRLTNAAGGGCLLVRRAALADLGGFDEGYFFYFEDLELSYRLRAQGELICCEPRALAYHDAGAGEPGLAFRGEGMYPTQRAYYVLLHRWMIVLTHYSARSLILLAPALILYEAAQLAECVRRGWLHLWMRALLRVIGMLPVIVRKRAASQRGRRVRDRDLLEGGPLPFSRGFIRSGLEQRLSSVLNSLLNIHWELVRRWL